MTALAKLKAEPGIWLTDVPVPEIGPSDLLIKVKKTGICGTDIHIYQWDKWAQKKIPVPMVIGHEFMGEVAAIGSVVSGFEVGERVSGEGHMTCGQCRNCLTGKRHLCPNTLGLGVDRQGCFAEYVVLPAANVIKVPDNIPDDVAAIFDPLGNAVHTALSFDLVGEDVLITGAGPIGIMAVAIARHAGARYVIITDINEYRLNLAKQMGATRAINVQKTSLAETLTELEITDGVSIGLEMSGNEKAFNDLLAVMGHGGKIGLLGILANQTAIDWHHVIFKGLFIKGIYGREIFETWHKMIRMLQTGVNIAPVITHHYCIDDFQKGFEAMLSGNSGKVVLSW